MNKCVLSRLDKIEQSTMEGAAEPVRIISGGSYTKEELAMIREAVGPSKAVLNPTVIRIIRQEIEQRPARALDDLLAVWEKD